jgi:hypothetical protein
MSEEIVACPGCAKKFRIPDGAAPNGAFDCTACGAAVKYGSKSAAASPGGRAKRAGGARGRAKAAARKGGKGRGARASKSAKAAPGGKGRGKGRSRRGEEAPEQPVQKGPPLIVPILCGVVVLILAVVIIINMKKPKQGPDSGSVATGTVTTGGITADPNSGAEPEPEPTPDPEPVTTQPAADPEPEVGGDSGIGGKDVEEKPKKKDERYYWYLDDSQLFIHFESTADTTADERAELDRLVLVMGDMASARDGTRATEEIIKKWGKKAFPSMLSTFQGKTWETLEEQFSSYQMQLAMRAIVKADLPRNKDFVARFTPQMTVPKEHFRTAGKMWICHWLGNLHDKDEFADFEEEEEEE